MNERIHTIGRLLLASAVVFGSIAANQMPMSNLVPFVGTWSCTSSANGSHEHGTTTYRRLPGTDTLGFEVVSPNYTGSGYLGYDQKDGNFFSVTADTYEGTSLSHGSLQPSGMLSLVGTATYSEKPAPMRELLGMPDPKHLRDRTEWKQNGKWTILDDSLCTRAT